MLVLLILFIFGAGFVGLLLWFANSPLSCDPNSAQGRMEMRAKREAEQYLYTKILMPVVGFFGAIIGFFIFVIGACVLMRIDSWGI